MLKKTFKTTFELLGGCCPDQENINLESAYDGKYYPGTLILQTNFNMPKEEIIVDFSMYETKKIIGYTVNITESPPTLEQVVGGKENLELLKNEFGYDEELYKKMFLNVNKPTIHKNVLVYQPIKGLWKWKSATS